MQQCKHCTTGVVLPRYRKGVPPTFKCNNCRRPYTPIQRALSYIPMWIRKVAA